MAVSVATRVMRGLVAHTLRLFFDTGGSSSKGKGVGWWCAARTVAVVRGGRISTQRALECTTRGMVVVWPGDMADNVHTLHSTKKQT
jgi:hypothetical protein